MKNMLYYPGFEVKSEAWLKFALLYMDQLQPIIPEEGRSHLSEQFFMIENETDLIVPHNPSVEEGTTATLDAIALVEKILQRPERYVAALGGMDSPSSWRMAENHQFTLLDKKYSPAWKEFCLTEKLASFSGNGVLISKSLGLIYMSFLTNVISEKTGIEPITDHSKMDRISILTRQVPPSARCKTKLANRIVQLKLPGNINDLALSEIIAHRNKNGFKENMHAFHSELEKHIEEMEGGETEETFLDSRGSIIREFSDEIASFGFGVATLPLSIWCRASNPVSVEDTIAGVIGGSALAAESFVSVRNTWRNTKETRMTRKYLAEIGTIHP